LGVRKVGIIHHEKFKQYDLGPTHPFRGDRFVRAMDFLEERGLLDLPNVSVFKPETAGKDDLLTVHTEEYVDYIFKLAEAGEPYDLDTPVSKPILEALMLIIGGALMVGRLIYSGEVDRVVLLGGGFHHAGRDYGGGFCLFNDIAILVERLRRKYGVKRILILDYDVHFGNGTSSIYYRDPTVLFISLHQDPRTIYPGTGFVTEIGEGEGEGFNVNIPLPPRTGEKAYLHIFREVFIPLAEEFKPEIIIGNGGSDAHFADSLGSLGLTTKGFFEISKTVSEVADRVCGGRVVLMVGSGYNPKVLPHCWYALISGLTGLEELGLEDPYPPPRDPWQNIEYVKKILNEIRAVLGKYWRKL